MGTVISDAPIRGFHVPVLRCYPRYRQGFRRGHGPLPHGRDLGTNFYIENNGEVPCPYRERARALHAEPSMVCSRSARPMKSLVAYTRHKRPCLWEELRVKWARASTPLSPNLYWR